MNIKMKNFICAFLLVWCGHQSVNAQKDYGSLSFIELGVGQRVFSEVPTNVSVHYDTINQTIDFGKGRPALLSLGYVFLPDENGLAGNIVLEGFLGKSSAIGVRLGAGYKLGNDQFSFTPMLSIGIMRTFNQFETIELDTGGVFAFNFNQNSSAVYIGSSESVNGVSGSNISLRAVNSLFDLKPMAYLSYKIADKFTLFGNVGFNINLANTEAEFEASGTGFENLDDLINEESPTTIVTEITSSSFLRNSAGKSLDRVPINYSGVFFQIGIGFVPSK